MAHANSVFRVIQSVLTVQPVTSALQIAQLVVMDPDSPPTNASSAIKGKKSSQATSHVCRKLPVQMGVKTASATPTVRNARMDSTLRLLTMALYVRPAVRMSLPAAMPRQPLHVRQARP